ncbi:hypothetical protein [Jeotgalicoccus sp. WY2]|uniref:hypothetical protein n=1 Tax=Jeotgalicoccus sp. WY2 TaxID=2708346 RepID=UPI001BD2CAE6|nr:hypothetical protein [Jeotgalicoccus sp. WY2]
MELGIYEDGEIETEGDVPDSELPDGAELAEPESGSEDEDLHRKKTSRRLMKNRQNQAALQKTQNKLKKKRLTKNNIIV